MYHQSVPFHNGFAKIYEDYACFYDEQENKLHILTTDLQELFAVPGINICPWHALDVIFVNGIAVVYKEEFQNRTYAFLNTEGHLLDSGKWEDINDVWLGDFVKVHKNGQFNYVDKNLQLALPFWLDDVRFDDDRASDAGYTLPVFRMGNKWGLYDGRLTEHLPIEYEQIEYVYMELQREPNTCQRIPGKVEAIFKVKKFGSDKWAFYSPEHRLLSEFIYDEQMEYEDGWATLYLTVDGKEVEYDFEEEQKDLERRIWNLQSTIHELEKELKPPLQGRFPTDKQVRLQRYEMLLSKTREKLKIIT